MKKVRKIKPDTMDLREVISAYATSRNEYKGVFHKHYSYVYSLGNKRFLVSKYDDFDRELSYTSNLIKNNLNDHSIQSKDGIIHVKTFRDLNQLNLYDIMEVPTPGVPLTPHDKDQNITMHLYATDDNNIRFNIRFDSSTGSVIKKKNIVELRHHQDSSVLEKMYALPKGLLSMYFQDNTMQLFASKSRNNYEYVFTVIPDAIDIYQYFRITRVQRNVFNTITSTYDRDVYRIKYDDENNMIKSYTLVDDNNNQTEYCVYRKDKDKAVSIHPAHFDQFDPHSHKFINDDVVIETYRKSDVVLLHESYTISFTDINNDADFIPAHIESLEKLAENVLECNL